MQLPTLSRIEKLILHGVSYGLGLDEVAQSLGLSQEEVGRQVGDVYTKLHLIEKHKSSPQTQYLLEPNS